MGNMENTDNELVILPAAKPPEGTIVISDQSIDEFKKVIKEAKDNMKEEYEEGEMINFPNATLTILSSSIRDADEYHYELKVLMQIELTQTSGSVDNLNHMAFIKSIFTSSDRFLEWRVPHLSEPLLPLAYNEENQRAILISVPKSYTGEIYLHLINAMEYYNIMPEINQNVTSTIVKLKL